MLAKQIHLIFSDPTDETKKLQITQLEDGDLEVSILATKKSGYIYTSTCNISLEQFRALVHELELER